MTILDLLYQKHHNDLCVPECKTGSTWFSHSCPRLDFLAIRRSWTHPNIYGYEIKKTRNDFLHDTKWRAYLDYCTDFYFVSPPGIIDKTELPEEAGLMITSKNGARLFTKKKAPTRSVDIPEQLYKYILICRVDKVSQWDDMHNTSNIDYWRNWLGTKNENKSVGHIASKKVQKIIRQRIDSVAEENKRLKADNENLRNVKDFIVGLGIDESEIRYKWRTEDRLKELISEKRTGIPYGLQGAINTAISSLKSVSKIISEHSSPETDK